MIGGFQVGPFQLAYQQGTAVAVRNPDGWRPRRKNFDEEILQDDEDVMRLFADAVGGYIKNRMEH